MSEEAGTKKYRVLSEVVVGETTHAEGAEVELAEEVASPLVADGKLEEVAAE